jgi:hypothetical protein
MRSISDFRPRGAEAGVGLALQDDKGCYLFSIAGTHHGCPRSERFYAGIGGHREPDEDWLACDHREAMEGMGRDVEEDMSVIAVENLRSLADSRKLEPLSVCVLGWLQLQLDIIRASAYHKSGLCKWSK